MNLSKKLGNRSQKDLPVRMQVKKYFVQLLISQNLDDNGIKITFYGQKLPSLFCLKLHN